jgi:hypothetical protein
MLILVVLLALVVTTGGKPTNTFGIRQGAQTNLDEYGKSTKLDDCANSGSAQTNPLAQYGMGANRPSPRMLANDLPLAQCPKPRDGSLRRSVLDYKSPNEVLQNTLFVIRTQDRPYALSNSLMSVAKYSPMMSVFVIDDSTTAPRKKKTKRIVDDATKGIFCASWTNVNSCDKNASPSRIELEESFSKPVQYWRVALDKSASGGEGYARVLAAMTAQKQKFKYVIMSDDDFELPDAQVLPQLAQALLSLKADVVAPALCNAGNASKSKGLPLGQQSCADESKASLAAMFVTADRDLLILPSVTRPYADDRIVHAINSHLPSSSPAPLTAGHKLECSRTDLLPRFFIAKTTSVVGMWDAKLTGNERVDAML